MGGESFPATLGARERWSTIAAVALGVGAMTILGVVFTARSGELLWLFLSLPFAFLLLLVGRYAPTAYRLTGEGVQIERRAGPKVLPYRTIRAVDREERRIAGIVLGGSRGAFGRFGRFWNGSLGFYRLYLTNDANVVWLSTENGWVGLSPDRPDEFVERLRSRIGLTR